MREAVALPPGEDLNEWLAVHSECASVPPAAFARHVALLTSAVDFYNEVSLLYGTISDFCTPESCPTMSAGTECVPCHVPFFIVLTFHVRTAAALSIGGLTAPPSPHQSRYGKGFSLVHSCFTLRVARTNYYRYALGTT